jgi:hypothetical protein
MEVAARTVRVANHRRDRAGVVRLVLIPTGVGRDVAQGDAARIARHVDDAERIVAEFFERQMTLRQRKKEERPGRRQHVPSANGGKRREVDLRQEIERRRRVVREPNPWPVDFRW